MSSTSDSTMPADDSFLKKRGEWFYVRVRVPPSLKDVFGAHITRALGTKDKSKAQSDRWDVVAAIKAEIAAVKANPVKGLAEAHKRKRAEGAPFDAGAHLKLTGTLQRKHGDSAAEEFVNRSFNLHTDLDTREAEWFADAKFQAKTELHYRHALALLRQHLQRQGLPEALEAVTPAVATSFKDYYVEKGTHRKTLNSYLSGLRSRWQMLIDDKVINPPNPWEGVRPKKSRKGMEAPRREWHADELLAIFRGPCSPRLFNLMSILLLTGARLSDVLGLTTADIEKARDVNGLVFIIREGKTKSAVRRVPVAPCLRAGVFAAVAGIKGVSNSWSNRFTEYRKEIGLTDKRTTLHSLRHSFSTLADANESLQRHHIQSVIGHSKGSATDIYTRVSDGSRQRVVEAVEATLPVELVALIRSRFGIGA